MSHCTNTNTNIDSVIKILKELNPNEYTLLSYQSVIHYSPSTYFTIYVFLSFVSHGYPDYLEVYGRKTCGIALYFCTVAEGNDLKTQAISVLQFHLIP